jgi:hypothetical protein
MIRQQPRTTGTCAVCHGPSSTTPLVSGCAQGRLVFAAEQRLLLQSGHLPGPPPMMQQSATTFTAPEPDSRRCYTVPVPVTGRTLRCTARTPTSPGRRVRQCRTIAGSRATPRAGRCPIRQLPLDLSAAARPRPGVSPTACCGEGSSSTTIPARVAVGKTLAEAYSPEPGRLTRFSAYGSSWHSTGTWTGPCKKRSQANFLVEVVAAPRIHPRMHSTFSGRTENSGC